MKKNFWLKIKKPILALAPMAGVSDSAFRQICRENGADAVYTEMISADGLYYKSKKTLALLDFNKKERPIVAQLFGKHPERFTRAAEICEKAGFDGIDINFGCPAKKVAGHGGGVTLMRDLPKCRAIIQAVLAGAKLPVSVKIRSSINVAGRDGEIVGADKNGAGQITALDFIAAVKDLPIAAVMIHGRPYENPFNAEIDYEMIKAVKNNFAGIVLGNGGIKSPSNAEKMLKNTGVDGVGLARGVYGRPWLFQEIKNRGRGLTGRCQAVASREINSNRATDFKKIKKIILRHSQLAFKAKGDHGLVELRKHLCWYAAGHSEAKKLRAELVKTKNIKQIKEILARF